MIFVTVGTQLPFDRLLSAMNSWASRNQTTQVLAQTGASKARFSHLQTVARLNHADFSLRFEAAHLVVAHAGMGTILTAAELGKPIILMPRLAKFGEHRNDHQLDTAAEMSRLSNVTIAHDGDALHQALDAATQEGQRSVSPCQIGGHTCDRLVEEIRGFVWNRAATASSADVPRRGVG